MTPENEIKKEYLNSYRWCMKALEQTDREITQLRLKALPGGISYDGMPHGSGSNNADLSNYVSELDKYLQKFKAQRDALMSNLDAIIRAIDQVKDVRSRVLLRYRYVELRTWPEVAKLMGYDETYVKRDLHGAALRYFKVPTKPHEDM